MSSGDLSDMPDKPPVFQVVQSAKLSQQISRQLVETIIAGHYKAGDLLPPERELAEMFRVSRVAVREALTTLGAKGILSVRQGRGTTVNPTEDWNTLDPEVLMILHGDEVLDQVMEMRRIFEPELAAMAASNITPGQLDELRAKSELPDSDTIEQHVERDTAFHIMIARATQNPVLIIVLTSISELLRECRRRTFVVPGELARARLWHRRIYEAIQSRDPAAARQAMADHMGQVREGLQKYESLHRTR
jgi:GntR family transcriptional repressor for pyruvate dehydrogenase complex